MLLCFADALFFSTEDIQRQVELYPSCFQDEFCVHRQANMYLLTFSSIIYSRYIK